MNFIAEEEYLPIAAVGQYVYCPRRFFLLYREIEFAENIHTVQGLQEHEKVDQIHHENKNGARIEYALPVWSKSIGLIGRCDVVEFYPDGAIYPIEYKHGKKQQWENDDLQLVAQALCLEEMLSCSIDKGAIYHIKSNRRREITIDEAIKNCARQIVTMAQELLRLNKIPKPTVKKRKCLECAMKNICKPELTNESNKLDKAYAKLFLVDEE